MPETSFGDWFEALAMLAADEDFELPPDDELQALHEQGMSPTDALVQLQIESVAD